MDNHLSQPFFVFVDLIKGSTNANIRLTGYLIL